ncbi:MAG: hypothetical protein IJQ68_03365 [Methanobrevibacter sp.]|uniref:hypothetical protein n=1 Tax=Methanobrevibacter sp. TaxID=66852 RepID=UPI0025F38AB0|nr:hypothetical protein [Methanobrevibacter sp.]MBR0271015.1 hypothetical protein [Methanobrevibacter sp.]
MKRYLILLLLFFLLIPFVSADENLTSNTYYVSADGAADGNGSVDNPFSDLRTAIDKSYSDDVIYIRGGTYSGVNNTNLVVPFSNLTIKAVEGEKVIIDGNKTNIFTINWDYFDISGITFVNAYSVQGSCFNIWSRYVTISDCDFINDSAQVSGGAINIRNNFLTVKNSNFINCYSFMGGAMHIEGAENKMYNCRFINCSASQAGAIDWQRKSSYLYDCVFMNCYASTNGGAMAVNENTVVFDNITVINCSAKKDGAVIYGTELKGTISNSMFTNNSANRGAVFHVYFDSNVNLVNSSLINNKASSSEILFNISINDSDVEIIPTFRANNLVCNAFNRLTESSVSFSNVTFWGIDGVMNSGNVENFVSGAENSQGGQLVYADYRQANQLIVVEVYDSNNILIENISQNTDIFGSVSLKLNNLSYGNYIVKAYHPENEYYTYISSSQNFEISKDSIIIESQDMDMYYHDGSRFIVNLTNNNLPIANASVTISLNGVDYTRLTDDNGLASLSINLNSGKYGINASYVDENNKTYATDAVIFVKSTVDASNLTKIYKNDSQFYAIFTDFSGHHLANTSVTFNINGVLYNRTTNSVGVARLNINLNQGTYIITSLNTLTGEKTSNVITVLPSITENRDLVKFCRNASQYVVRICDKQGNVVSGENVTFNINGVFYNRTSNATGHAKLNINLQPGNYIITAIYDGCMVSNNITVLQVLSAEDLVKNYGTSDPFVAKLIDGVGKPYSGQNITFNINGVFYNRLTDADGLARLNINLQSGEYIITSIYDQMAIGNRVTVI